MQSYFSNENLVLKEQLIGTNIIQIQNHTHKNKYLNHLIDLSFQEVNRLFELSFENKNERTSYSEYYLPKEEIKDYNVMIDGKKLFD